MDISPGGEKKASVSKAHAMEQRAAQRFGVALRLTVDGDEGATHDLSATGLYFQSERSYEPGANMALVLEFPGTGRGHPLTCEAQVVRVKPAGDGFNIAVRLLTPLFPDRA
ncbi:PilZ domain-containing protein [Polaromonas sp.]|uniref:PilZ domain-containing protein n=1 Tax=Polaromonas sp. TaxID=1869339 RepID=UPI0024880E23|nr:PilZ domain-containing protein [Polaromonas sp.]MDI1340779.1 PilZ domain-containing protein [Polaromonas sp.]